MLRTADLLLVHQGPALETSECFNYWAGPHDIHATIYKHLCLLGYYMLIGARLSVACFVVMNSKITVHIGNSHNNNRCLKLEIIIMLVVDECIVIL